MKARVVLIRGVAVLAVAGVVALAWMPFPPLQHISEPWLPGWAKRVISFFAQEDFLCNVLGFFLLTLAVQPVFPGKGRARRWRCAWWLAALVVTLECGQLFLPHRFFDLKDIASGWLGVAAGSLPWFIADWRASRPAADGA